LNGHPPRSPTFQPEIALAYARELSYPRRVGTPGEAAAIEAIAARLTAAGYAVERQVFAFSTGGQVAASLELVAALTLILLIFWAWGVSLLAGLVPAALLLALLALTGCLQRLAGAASLQPAPGEAISRWRRLWLRLGEHCQSINVVARSPEPPAAGPPAARARLYLVAHSDSKSQALPLVARMLLIALAGLAAVVFASLTLLRPLWPGVTSAAALAGLFALVVGVVVLFLFLAGAGNASPGAIDNASGAGLVLHLAEVLAEARPLLDVTWLVTGAEELGVVGATAFVLSEQRAGRLAQAGGNGGAYVLNFDGIGAAGRLALVGGGRTNQLAAIVRACCVELHLPLGRLPLVGALFDHIPFEEAGCQAVSLVTLGPAGRSVHTRSDSADKLDVRGFRQAGEVALRVVEKLEKSDWGLALRD
jgi:hypothetical protein